MHFYIMDILTHTASGLAIGTVIASVAPKGLWTRAKLIFVSGFGAALPDIDAISLWSKFDPTIGSFLGLEHSGRVIYSEKFWYSHHAFMHSATAALLIVLGGVLLSSLFRKTRPSKIALLSYAGFFLGFLIHLWEDMPTPAGNWGGVNLFFPSETYVGGWGKIWWWNNYDLFLIALAVFLLNVIFLLCSSIAKTKIFKPVLGAFFIGFCLLAYQVNSREFDFNYSRKSSKYQAFEQKSKEIQQSILGQKIYSWMESFDNQLSLYF